MANNLIQVKRTSVSGRAANSTTLPNPGELALNMTDGILYSTNGATVFEIGANNTNARITGTLTVNAISANGTVGTNNQVLTSNGSRAYWKEQIIKDLADVAANGATDTQVLTYNSTLNKWVNQNPPVANVVYTTGYYGAFYDLSNQYATGGSNTATVTRLANTFLSNGLTRTANDELQVAYAGVYQINYSLQLMSSSNKNETVWVWLRKNGTDVPESGTDFGIYPVSGGTNGYIVAVTSLIDSAAAGDKFQLMWATSSNTTVSMTYLANTAFAPETPSAIVSVIPISNIITAPPGTNTDVTFNDSGLANGAAGLTYNKTTNSVSVANNLLVGNTVNASAFTVNGTFWANSTSVNSATFQVGSSFTANSTLVNAAALLVRGGAAVNNTLTVNAISANGGVGTTGQALYTDGTKAYWNTVVVATNTAAQYVWTNTHTFQNTVTFGNSTVNSTVNSTGIYATALSGNLTGNVVATTISGNLTGNVTATTISGNLTGNVVATTISGNLTGNVVATTLSGNLTGNVTATVVNASSNVVVGNSTVFVYSNTTAFVGNVVATRVTGNLTGNVTATTISGNLTGNVVATTISGNLTGNVVATTISGNLTGNVVATNVNAATIQVSTSITLDNDKNLQWKAKNTSTVVGMRQQSDDNFVFYSTDATYAARPVFAIFANSSTSNLQMLVPLNIQSSLGANGSFGTAGQVLTTNGSGVYWNTVTAVVNTAAQFAWTNTHSFAANISITANALGLATNSSAVYFNGTADANWRIGRNTGGTPKWFYTGNTIDIIAANTATEGIVLGFTGNSYLETGYNGTYVKDRLVVGNSTSSVSANATAFVGNVVATSISGNLTGNVAAVTITGNLTGNVAATTISGNLTAITISGNLTGNVAAVTITGNLTGNVVATTISGNLSGNVTATTISGNLTGNVSATTVNATTVNATANIVVGSAMLINSTAIQVGNSTVRTIINTTAFAGNVVATTLSGNLTGNVVATTVSGNLTGNVVATTISGNLTAVTANVTNKIQVGIPGAFDFGSNAVIEIDANGNTYVQSVIQNANTGNNASADLVVTNDTGNDSFNYVDLGINGSNYNQPGYSIVGASDAYLYASHGNLAIGTQSSKDIVFHAGGTTTSNKKMSINSTSIVFDNSSALVANSSSGTAGHILHSNGTGIYWAVDDQGVTSVASGNGITGGTIVNTGTLSVTQGTGVVVNTSGVHVNATYINTISANSATFLGAAGNFGNATGIYTSGLVNAATVNATTIQVGTNFLANATQVTAADLLVTGNLVVNGTMVTLNTATLDVRDLNITLAKGTASAAAANGAGITVDGAAATLTYINASNTWLSNINFSVGNTISNVSVNSTAFIGNVVATAISGNLTGNVTATTISGNLTGNVVAVTITGNLTGNVVAGTVNATTINATSSIVVGANVLVNTSVLLIGNSTANVFVNSTAFVGNVVATTVSGNLSGTAANATLLNNKTEGNLNVNSALYANASITNTFTVGTGTYFVSNGNVGVGTTTPGSKLQVTGSGISISQVRDTSTTGYSGLTHTGTGTQNYSIGMGGPSETSFGVANKWFIYDGLAGAMRVVVDSSGNVGIGNTAPAHRLRVTGTTSLAGAVSDITTLAAGNTTITGFVNASTNVTTNTVWSTNIYSTFANSTTVNSTTINATTVNANLSGNVAATTVSVSANVTVGANVFVNTSAILLSNSTDRILIDASDIFIGNTSITTAPQILVQNTSGITTVNAGTVSTTTVIAANVAVGANVIIDTAKASFGTGSTTNAPQVIVSNTSGTTTVNAGIISTTTFNATTVNATTINATTVNANLAGNVSATTITASGLLTATGGSKISVMNQQDGGSSRGIFLWDDLDSNWGIYMSQAGASKSLGNGTAAGGLNGSSTYAVRFRAANATPTDQAGFIWENHTEVALMQLEPTNGDLFVRRNVQAVDFNSTSDARYKSDIVKIQDALDKVYSLSGYTFTMNETGERSTGLIAQEVEKVLPEAVKGDDKKTLSYGNMIGLLVEAIKEQGRKIEVLESELNKLRER
jgi:hypothetical protein